MILKISNKLGDFENYSLTKFPDNSLKFKIKLTEEQILQYSNPITVDIHLRTNDDLVTLGLIKTTLDEFLHCEKRLKINYMMYQQDDRLFDKQEFKRLVRKNNRREYF